MISAGQYFRGINPYGARPRQPRTKEELEKQLRQGREKLDKMLKQEIAKLKKADPHFETCPIIEKDKEGEYLTKFGELCRGAKDKLSTLLSHKPDPSIAAAIKKDKLREVPKEEVLTKFQRYYLVRYMTNFKTLTEVKAVLKQLKDKPRSAKLKKKYNVEYWKFLRLYNTSLKSWFKRKYALVDGKIYQIPTNTKRIKAKGKSTHGDLQCFDRSNGSLIVYEDCSCSVKGGSTGCAWLEEDAFQKRTGDPAKGKIRTRIYYNPTTNKLRLVPTKVSFAPPKGFKPISLTSLKWFLSRHKEAKDGGKKLLLDFLGAKDAKNIFRNEDGHYVTDIDTIDFLSRFSVYNEGVHKSRTYPAGIYLNEKEAKELITKVNKDLDILMLTRGMPPFNPTNFARSPTKQSDLWEYMIPKDPALLLKVFELVDKMKEGKVKTSLPSKTVNAMHGRLKHLVKADLSANFRHEMAKWQKEFSKASKDDQTWWQRLGMGLQILFMAVIGVSTWFSVKIGRESLKNMRIMMLQSVKPEKASKLLRAEQDKMDEKQRLKGIKKLEKKESKSKLTPAEDRTLTSLKNAQQKYIEESGLEDWERDIMDLTVKEGKEMRGELVEQEMRLLKDNPDWIIPGRDREAWEALRARTNSGEETSPFIYGPSGSGKRYVHMAAAQKVAMAYIYANDKAELEIRLRTKYQERYNAHPEFYGNDAGRVEWEVQRWMGKYQEAAENLDPRLRNHRFYLIHNAKLQAGTMFRGAQAEKVLQCFAANQHNGTPIMQEFATILMAGATGGGGGQEMDVSESVLELTKQHIEGSSEVGATEAKEGGSLSNGINADTTPHRALKVQTDPRSEDLKRRFLWIDNNAWSPQETLEHIHSPRIYEVIENKYNVRLSPEAREAAVRIGVHFEGKPGRIPLTAANSVLKGAADHVVKAEKRNGWNGKEPIVITVQNMFDYARSRYNVEIKDQAEVGKLKMQQPREYFMFKRDVRAMQELASGTVTIRAANTANSELVLQHIRGNEPGIVRKIATTIDLDAIGDFEDVERDPRKGMEAARTAVTYARRLHKLGGDEIPTNTNDLQLWIEQNLEKVMPVKDTVIERAETVLQEEILRTMDPTNEKYKADSIAERNELMLKEAIVLETRVLEHANDPLGEKSLYETIQSIPVVVSAYELDRQLPPAPASTGLQITDAMLATHKIEKGTLTHYLATEHMDAKEFNEADFIKITYRAAAIVGEKLGDGKLNSNDVDKIAEDAIKTAAGEVRGPDDPGTDPTRGSKGEPKGPGSVSRSDAPRPEAAPKPASEGGDPKARARTELIGKIETMLPKSLKPYAKHVAVVCEHKPALLKLNGASQRGLFTALASKAMQRHPEVIGGTRAGVQAAKARRRGRKGLDGKERRAEELRRIEHLRRLEEMQRRRRAGRATK